MNMYCKINTYLFAEIIVILLILQSCTTNGLVLRKSSSDGYGPLIPNCQNVSPNTRITGYQTEFYHSTRTSALVEGAQVGIMEALDIDNDTSGGSGEDRYVELSKEFAYDLILQVFGIDARNYPHPPFCMKFNAPPRKVKNKIADIITSLRNPIKIRNKKQGLFGTKFANRKKNYNNVRWKDRYIISTARTTKGKTVVKVFRDLLISRNNERFVRAESDGHNEAWFLTQISSKLKRSHSSK